MFERATELIPVFFLVVFALIFGVIIVTAVRAVGEKRANDASPVREKEAVVSARRTHVSRAVGGGTVSANGTVPGFRTRRLYYVTFEMPDGGELELRVQRADYDRLSEGDRGILTVQGTRFVGFRGSEEET